MTVAEGFKKMDIFGKELPSFNLKGKDRVHTIFGGFCTLILLVTIFQYGTLKMTSLITKTQPRMSSYFKEDVLSDEFSINLKERNFRFAFTVEGFFT